MVAGEAAGLAEEDREDIRLPVRFFFASGKVPLACQPSRHVPNQHHTTLPKGLFHVLEPDCNSLPRRCQYPKIELNPRVCGVLILGLLRNLTLQVMLIRTAARLVCAFPVGRLGQGNTLVASLSTIEVKYRGTATRNSSVPLGSLMSRLATARTPMKVKNRSPFR